MQFLVLSYTVLEFISLQILLIRTNTAISRMSKISVMFLIFRAFVPNHGFISETGEEIAAIV